MDEQNEEFEMVPGEVEEIEFQPVKYVAVAQKWFGESKTLWINGLILVAALAAWVAGPDFPLHLSEEALSWVIFAQSVINMVLRLVTNGPVQLKK